MLEALVTLRVGLLEGSTSSNRQNRRAYLSPDVLRTYKLAAGDWAILSPHNTHDAAFAVVQLWPRAGLEDDCASLTNEKIIKLIRSLLVVMISPGQLVNLSLGDIALYRFDPGRSSKGLLRSITVKDVPKESTDRPLRPGAGKEPVSERETAWLRAAIKEALSPSHSMTISTD